MSSFDEHREYVERYDNIKNMPTNIRPNSERYDQSTRSTTIVVRLRCRS